jgi:hypothetical protein
MMYSSRGHRIQQFQPLIMQLCLAISAPTLFYLFVYETKLHKNFESENQRRLAKYVLFSCDLNITEESITNRNISVPNK